MSSTIFVTPASPPNRSQSVSLKEDFSRGFSTLTITDMGEVAIPARRSSSNLRSAKAWSRILLSF